MLQCLTPWYYMKTKRYTLIYPSYPLIDKRAFKDMKIYFRRQEPNTNVYMHFRQ